MTVDCYACGQQFSGTKALRAHHHYCKEKDNWFAGLKCVLEDKELEMAASAKQARISLPLDSQDIHGSSVDGAEDIVLEPPQDLPPPSISRSGCRQRVPRALKDYLPHMLVGLPPHLHPLPPDPQATVISTPSPAGCMHDLKPEPEPKADLFITTEPNNFGLY